MHITAKRRTRSLPGRSPPVGLRGRVPAPPVYGARHATEAAVFQLRRKKGLTLGCAEAAPAELAST